MSGMPGFACSRRHFLRLAGGALLAPDFASTRQSLPVCGPTPVIERADLAGQPDPRSITGTPLDLAVFAHVSDTHLADAAHPLRATLFDALFGAAWRPQQHLAAGVWDAIVAHINARAMVDGFEWIMCTGDQVDNALVHELDWWLAISDGAELPDSYARQVGGYPDWRAVLHDAPVPEVAPSGSALPWYAALGNHDLLALGVFSPVLLEAIFGPLTRWRQRWPERFPAWQFEYLERAAAIDAYQDSGGCGFAGPFADPGGYYAFSPAPVLRCIVLNTAVDDWIAAQTALFLRQPAVRRMLGKVHADGVIGGSRMRQLLRAYLSWLDRHPLAATWQGALTRAQFDWMCDEIDTHADCLCLIFSHHGPDAFAHLPGHVSPAQFIAALCARPQVVAHLHGHSHCNRVVPSGDTPAYWDVTTGSLAEFPMQWRSVRVVDRGDGMGVLQCRMRGPALEGGGADSVYDRALTLAAGDRQLRRAAPMLCGLPEDRNVDLLFCLPPAVAARLTRHAAGTAAS